MTETPTMSALSHGRVDKTSDSAFTTAVYHTVFAPFPILCTDQAYANEFFLVDLPQA